MPAGAALICASSIQKAYSAAGTITRAHTGTLWFRLRVTGVPAREWRQRVTVALRTVGLEHKKHALPLQLSQGEQQRVAIARAIVSDPPIMLADEPTGNLDPDNSREVLKVLQNVNLRGTTVIVATHARELVETYRHRTLTLRKGKLVRDDPLGGYTL